MPGPPDGILHTADDFRLQGNQQVNDLKAEVERLRSLIPKADGMEKILTPFSQQMAQTIQPKEGS